MLHFARLYLHSFRASPVLLSLFPCVTLSHSVFMSFICSSIPLYSTKLIYRLLPPVQFIQHLSSIYPYIIEFYSGQGEPLCVSEVIEGLYKLTALIVWMITSLSRLKLGLPLGLSEFDCACFCIRPYPFHGIFTSHM
jgi:hypothetical protein